MAAANNTVAAPSTGDGTAPTMGGENNSGDDDVGGGLNVAGGEGTMAAAMKDE